MKLLEKVVLVAAYTSRSKSYIQAVLKAGFTFDKAILFGDDVGNLPGQTSQVFENSHNSPVFLPNLQESIDQSLEGTATEIIKIAPKNINAPSLIEKLKSFEPSLIVYSGYGGQIVSKDVLEIAPVLHMHSGWLPDYRGSTTLYYSWLDEEYVGVSAIIMSDQIDKGDVLLRKRFPVPPNGINADYIYDSAVRADTLVDLLKKYDVLQKLPEGVSQNHKDAHEYYVIHPLLKHLLLIKQGQ